MKRAGLIGGSAAALATTVALLTQLEGVRTTSYQDIVGVWTICAGETRGVGPGDTATPAECDAMLAKAIVEFENGLDKCLDDQIEAVIPTETKIAMVSWAYNVGLGAACRSTLVRKANAGDLRGACDELPRWRMAGGRIVQGLVNRRVTERKLCLAGLQE